MAELAYISPLRLIDLYVFYGFSFLVLAIVVFLQPRSDRMLPFASELWLLGLFGSFHGIKEWLDAWMLLNRADGAVLRWLNASILVSSYLALFEFGRRLAMICAASSHERQPVWRPWLGAWIYLPLLTGLFHFHFIGETIGCALSKQRGDGNGENGQRA